MPLMFRPLIVVMLVSMCTSQAFAKGLPKVGSKAGEGERSGDRSGTSLESGRKALEEIRTSETRQDVSGESNRFSTQTELEKSRETSGKSVKDALPQVMKQATTPAIHAKAVNDQLSAISQRAKAENDPELASAADELNLAVSKNPGGPEAIGEGFFEACTAPEAQGGLDRLARLNLLIVSKVSATWNRVKDDASVFKKVVDRLRALTNRTVEESKDAVCALAQQCRFLGGAPERACAR